MTPRLTTLLAVWTVALVLGWGAVIGLGAPVSNSADELAAAMHPVAPVSETAARASAATIVRLQHRELVTIEPTVHLATDFGQQRWVIVYAQADPVSGVRISIDVKTGEVRVTTFP
jgi:hypothetical protein